MTDMSTSELDLEAIERRAAAALDLEVTTRVDVPALVRELREARRERDEARADLEKIQRLYLSFYEQDPRVQNYQEVTIVREPDGAEFVLTVRRKEGKTPGAVAAEASAALAASEKRCAELKASERSLERQLGKNRILTTEAMARAERAEAACAEVTAQAAVMRARLLTHGDAFLDHAAGKALAERVKLLEAVVRDATAFLEWQRLHDGRAPFQRSHLCTSLAALDAHDKKGGAL